MCTKFHQSIICSFDFIGGGPTRSPPGCRWSKTPRPGRVNIDNKLIFVDSFQFLSSSLGSLVKNVCKNDFKYLSQEFDSKVLDLVKQKGYYPDENISSFKKSK